MLLLRFSHRAAHSHDLDAEATCRTSVMPPKLPPTHLPLLEPPPGAPPPSRPTPCCQSAIPTNPSRRRAISPAAAGAGGHVGKCVGHQLVRRALLILEALTAHALVLGGGRASLGKSGVGDFFTTARRRQ